MNKISMETRVELMESGILELVNDINKHHFNEFKDANHKIPTKIDYETALDYERFLFFNEPDLLSSAQKVIVANYKRMKRLKNRIYEYVQHPNCKFITLTFNDDTLNKTNKETRRRYVKMFLKSLCSDYVANIDYGKKNEREHYHCVGIVVNDSVSWSYGFTNIKKVSSSEKDATKLARYTNKLTYHAIKKTTQQNYCIYSKKCVKYD